MANTDRLSLKVPRIIGFGAGVLALGLIVFSACGAIWGLLRPTMTGTVRDDGAYVITGPDNVQFVSFVSFAAVTGVLAVCLTLTVYLRNRSRRGLGTLIWVTVVAALGAFAFFVVGGATAASFPENPGITEEFVPAMDPGIGWLIAPFMASFAYWSAVFIGGVEEW